MTADDRIVARQAALELALALLLLPPAVRRDVRQALARARRLPELDEERK